MNRKNTIARIGLAGAILLASPAAFAQDIHFTQFDASPLTINPAFTGGFDGTVRAAAIYRDQWRSILGSDAAFKTISASVDAPILRDLSVDDYLAAGIQLYSDKAGDGNLSNTSVLASIAYHKFLGGGNSTDPNKVLTVGLQGGYSSKSVDLSKLYFSDEYINGNFNPGTSSEYQNLNNDNRYFTINAGIAWSHSPSERFGYTLGMGANNLNQPNDNFTKKINSEVGLAMRYTAQAGFIWYTGDRLSIRPGLLYQSQATATEVTVGSEFNYIVGIPEDRPLTTSVFVGVWSRLQDAMMVTAGVEHKNIRFGVSYDYNNSDLKPASNGNGAFEISIRYVAPNPIDLARRLVYPCSRF